MVVIDSAYCGGPCSEADIDRAMAYSQAWSEFYDEAKPPMQSCDGWILFALLTAGGAGMAKLALLFF